MPKVLRLVGLHKVPPSSSLAVVFGGPIWERSHGYLWPESFMFASLDLHLGYKGGGVDHFTVLFGLSCSSIAIKTEGYVCV